MDYNERLHGTSAITSDSTQDVNTVSVDSVCNQETVKSNETVQIMETAGVSSESEILSQHFFREFEPMLCETKAKLNDVKQNQTVLIESLEREKDKLKEISMINEIEEAMSTVHSYRMKLVKIKRSMGLLKEASTRIRKEACHLEQLKRKEKVKEQERNRQALEEENKLTAQLSKQFK